MDMLNLFDLLKVCLMAFLSRIVSITINRSTTSIVIRERVRRGSKGSFKIDTSATGVDEEVRSNLNVSE